MTHQTWVISSYIEICLSVLKKTLLTKRLDAMQNIIKTECNHLQKNLR